MENIRIYYRGAHRPIKSISVKKNVFSFYTSHFSIPPSGALWCGDGATPCILAYYSRFETLETQIVSHIGLRQFIALFLIQRQPTETLEQYYNEIQAGHRLQCAMKMSSLTCNRIETQFFSIISNMIESLKCTKLCSNT